MVYFVVGQVDGPLNIPGIVWHPPEAALHRLILIAANVDLGMIIVIGTGPLVESHSHAAQKRITDQRSADRDPCGAFFIAANNNVGLTLQLIGRPCRNEVNGTHECVAPVPRALRSFQDFDAFQVELARIQTLAAGYEHTVHEHRGVVFFKNSRGCDTPNDRHREKFTIQV